MALSTEALAAELAEDSQSIGYADHLKAGNDTRIVALLNAPSVPSLKAGTWVTELGILDLLGPEAGEEFLQGLEVAAGSNPVVARVLRILKQSSGIGNPMSGVDLGTASVQGMLAVLAEAGAIKAEARDALVAAGSRLWSRAEILGGVGTRVRHEEVAKALGRG